MEALTQSLLALPMPSVLFVVMTGAARAMGALFGLWGLYFVLGPAAMMRMVLALILAAPAIVGNLDGIIALLEETPSLGILFIPVREFVLGLALGLLASLPFFAILGASMMVDQYRGDFSPGNLGPESQMIGSFATLKVAMSLFLFFEVGGFALLIGSLYQSYALFPPGLGSLAVSPDFAARIGQILQSVFVTLLLVALPVVLILLLIDFAVNVTLRLSNQIKLPAYDFLLKNLIFTLAMPVLVYGLIRVIRMAFDRHPDALGALQGLLTP